jgi:hypothetical protein
MSVAGAFGAMGADFGAISYNPASLGNYWKGELVFTLGSQNTKSKSKISNNINSATDQAFTFDNIGLVSNWREIRNINNPRSGSSGNSDSNTSDNVRKKIVSRSFAIGLNNVASYNYYMEAEGNTPGSIMEDGDLFDGVDYSSFEEFNINKSQKISESGSQKELVIAYGQNNNDKVLWGISMGIPFISYSTERDYLETAPGTLINDPNLDFYFKNVQYSNSYSTVGVGINIKGGMIFKLPSNTRDWIFDTIDYEGYFDYNLRTPWKFIGSVGKIFGNENFGGFINMDAEYTHNQGMKYNYRKYSSNTDILDAEKEINEKLNKDLKGAFNIRLGGELAIRKLRLRAGAAFYDSPFKSDADFNPATVLSGGIGYRGDSFYIDLAYVNSQYNYAYYPYVADNKTRSPKIEIDKTINKFNATVGLKF